MLRLVGHLIPPARSPWPKRTGWVVRKFLSKKHGEKRVTDRSDIHCVGCATMHDVVRPWPTSTLHTSKSHFNPIQPPYSELTLTPKRCTSSISKRNKDVGKMLCLEAAHSAVQRTNLVTKSLHLILEQCVAFSQPFYLFVEVR